MISVRLVKLLKNTKMFVDGTEVKPVDICFATEGMKGFEDDLNNLQCQ